MATDMALRFAKTSLSLFQHEKIFSICVSDEEDLDPIAAAFESIGCTVTRKDAIRLILTVFCGEGAELSARNPHRPAERHPYVPGREREKLPGIVPTLGDTIVLASHMRAVARETVAQARETRLASKEAAMRFARDRERRKQDVDRRGP